MTRTVRSPEEIRQWGKRDLRWAALFLAFSVLRLFWSGLSLAGLVIGTFLLIRGIDRYRTGRQRFLLGSEWW